MPSNSRENKKEGPKVHAEIAKQMVTLSTSAFGLVAALAWNSFIQEFFKDYINKLIPGNGSILSMLFYALIVTVLAVIVTLQLSKIAGRFDK